MRKVKFIIATLFVIFALPVSAGNDSTNVYTKEHPLIYEDAWDLWPYSFLDVNGEPVGYNIDVLKLILKRLDIPYVIKLKRTRDALKDLQERRSDLMCGMNDKYHQGFGVKYSNTILSIFPHSIVRHKNTPLNILKFSDLRKYRVIVHENSFSHKLMTEQGLKRQAILSTDMATSVQRANEGTDVVLWNTASLRWLINKYKLENLVLTPVDMPHGEYHFLGNDEALLHQIDSVYHILDVSDELTPLQNKWFHPELKMSSGIPSWVWRVMLGLLVFAALVVGWYFYYRYREKKTNGLVRHRNARLSLVLQSGQVNIWTYDVDKGTFTSINTNGKAEREYKREEFSKRYGPQTFAEISTAIKEVTDGEKNTHKLTVTTEDEENPRILEIAVSPLRYKGKQVSEIIGTQNDVTEERERQRKAKMFRERYETIFSTALVDMIYYDENGIITDVNDKICESFGIQDKQAFLDSKVSINQLFLFSGVDIMKALEDGEGQLHATTLYNFDKVPKDVPRLEMLHRTGEMYYEYVVQPIYDEDNHLICIIESGRDLTEMVHSYRKTVENNAQLAALSKNTQEYINRINYILQASGSRMANYYPETQRLTINSTLDTILYDLPAKRCIDLLSEEYREDGIAILQQMNDRMARSIDLEVKTRLRNKEGEDIQLQLSFVPLFDKNGLVDSYFGLCLDISKIKAAEEQLQKETAKAQELETVKNAFLKNMSYEIRTPLNTVVGFSELFESEHSAEDEAVFIQEIKTNTDRLLILINDILFLSRLDANMIEFNPQPIDFAGVFDSHVQMGWMNNRHEGVEYKIENPFNSLTVNVDDGNLGKVIENVVENAAQHTRQGSVTAKYEYEYGRLVITVSDTGNGIPKEYLSRIFDRFATGRPTGSGLGLAICHQLVEQMGGSIRVTSEVNVGTTVCITIPCKATMLEHKKENRRL